MAVDHGPRHSPSTSRASAPTHLKAASRSAPTGTPRLRRQTLSRYPALSWAPVSSACQSWTAPLERPAGRCPGRNPPEGDPVAVRRVRGEVPSQRRFRLEVRTLGLRDGWRVVVAAPGCRVPAPAAPARRRDGGRSPGSAAADRNPARMLRRVGCSASPPFTSGTSENRVVRVFG